MQNENAGKTVEQIAAELNPYRKDAHSYDAWQDGYTTAQQSQPMWREIEGDKAYKAMVKKRDEVSYKEASGRTLLNLGYTHYLSSDDLLRLPTEKK